MVKSTRDVTFDPSKGYDTRTKKIEVTDEIIEILKVSQVEVDNKTELQNSIYQNEDYNFEDNEASDEETGNQEYTENEINNKDMNMVKFSGGLPTPESTPGPESSISQSSENEQTADRSCHKNQNIKPPSREIIGDPEDPRNIIEGKRQQKRKVYFEMHQALHQQSVFHLAFQTSLRHMKSRLHQKDLPPPPQNWHQLQHHPHCDGFTAAARAEFSGLELQETFKDVSQSENKTRPIPTKWVFTYKFDDDGYFRKYKARLVVRGDLQIPTEKDSYAATLAVRLCRAALAIASYFNLECNQFNVTNAFPHASLDDDDEVFINYPEGFKKPSRLLRVLKALYGLSATPRLWYNHLSKTLEKLGLKCVPESGCIFTNEKLIVFFDVDDIVVFYHMSNREAFQELKNTLLEVYTIRDLGELKWFLGLRIIRDRNLRKMWLIQDSYIEKKAREFKRLDSHGNLKNIAPKTPMSTQEIKVWDGKANAYQIHEYQRRVGSLTYAAVVSRPDIAKATQKLAEFQNNPSPEHMIAADRVLDYLYETRFFALEYGMGVNEGPVFIAASDASFGDNISSRVSSEARLFKLFGGTIDYAAKKQTTVTTSSIEAELLALSHIASWLIWWRRFFENISLDLEQDPSIWCDNLQTVRLMMKESPKLVSKLKHVDIHNHWLRQETLKGNIKIEWIQIAKMPADGLTKCL